jgi:hypothetical protein
MRVTLSPSTLALKPAPITPLWVRTDHPQAHGKLIGESADGMDSIFVWSCSPGVFVWNYDYDEVCYFLSGSVLLFPNYPHDSLSIEVGAGDVVQFEAGDSILWDVSETVQKIAICHSPLSPKLQLAQKLWRALKGRKPSPSLAVST